MYVDDFAREHFALRAGSGRILDQQRPRGSVDANGAQILRVPAKPFEPNHPTRSHLAIVPAGDVEVAVAQRQHSRLEAHQKGVEQLLCIDGAAAGDLMKAGHRTG